MHFTYFCKKGGGGAVNFGSLFSFVPIFYVFRPVTCGFLWSIQMTSISSVDTPVDRRRFVFYSVFVAY